VTFVFERVINIRLLLLLLLAAEGTALVASGAARHLQPDVQDTPDVSTGVSQSAHQGIMQRHSVAAIIDRSASRRALQTD